MFGKQRRRSPYCHRRVIRLTGFADLAHEIDGGAIDPRQGFAVEAGLRAPVQIGTPGRALQDKLHAVADGQKDVAVVVGPKGGAASIAFEQPEGLEERQVPPFVENESCLQATIGEKPSAAQLQQPRSVL
jgi:hypothetical protein